MVLYDPKRQWIDRGLCRKLDPEPFFAPGGQPDRKPQAKTQALWNEAKEACVFCPVLEECRRDTLGEEYGVWGGLDEHERHLARRRLADRAAWKKWPKEERLEWGEHLAGLRTAGFSYVKIQRRTGFNVSVVEGLIEEWKASLPPEPAQAEVVELKLPGLVKPDFPEGKGSKHAWVRNGNLVADGWYAGETADGRWIKMQIYSVRGHVFKFFRPDDVKFYSKQRRWVVSYSGRPDAPDVQEDAHAA